MAPHTTIIVYVNQVENPTPAQAAAFKQKNLCAEIADAIAHGLVDYDKYGIEKIRVATPDGQHFKEF